MTRLGLTPTRTLLAAVAPAVVLAAMAPQAFAHAALLASTPPPGARIERSQPEITLRFTEPLNRGLSKATLLAVAGGARIPASSRASAKELVVRPDRPLGRGAYRVEWHSVSTQDGHALEGSFGFGVRAAAIGGEHRVEQSPLAQDGWLRIALRALFYASLFFFAGGVLLAALLGRGQGLGQWLVPVELHPALVAAGRDPQGLLRRVSARTIDAGMFALAASVAVTLEEASDAGGGFSASSVRDFLLTNAAGIARVASVVALAAAVRAAPRLRGISVLACVLVFLAIALSGHANSAEQRLVAVVTDWVHLVAGALWLGGIAQIAITWLSLVRFAGAEIRLGVMRNVLEPFGRVALPAFFAVAGTGVVNALIQLGQVSALWDSAYGRILALKIALVGLIALASYFHAVRLRPRLLAANPHPPRTRERRHWRLLRAEPLLGAGVVVVAATLVAFPLPPRQLSAADEAEAAGAQAAPCSPCPLARPRASELAVAEHAGSSVVAAWLRRDGPGLAGELRVFGLNQRPVRRRPRIPGATLSHCGPGCWKFRLAGRPRTVAVAVPEKGRLYTARLPARWRTGEATRARRLLYRAQATMRNLHSVRERESITSGPGSFVATRYRLQAPNRLAIRSGGGGESIVVGTHQWSRSAGAAWREDRYGGGGPGFRTRSWFAWTNYARSVRLLSVGGRTAKLALMDPGTPVWLRLTVDLDTSRVVAVRMIADGHFMSQRFHAFNQPSRIRPPRVS